MKIMKGISALVLAAFVFAGTANVFGASRAELSETAGEYASLLKSNGIAGVDNPDSYAATDNSNVSVESVRTLGSHCIVVTFDSKLESFDPSDIKLQAYTSDWYSLSPAIKDRISCDNYSVSVNSQGKTVVVYHINEEIQNDVLAPSFDDKTDYTAEEAQEAITKADNIISWQMDNGGWDKGYDLHISRQWDGVEKKNCSSGWTALDGTPCGTIDNSSTYTHMADLALAYALTGQDKYKTSFEKGLEFLKKLQYPTGGFAQVYPPRGNYSDYVTLNDDAMVNVLIMLEKIEDKRFPYNTGVVSDEYYGEVCKMIEYATDYLIKAQIVDNGESSAWCAQHDPVTYEPRSARAYEPIGISGSESIGAIKFLMNQRDNEDAIRAAESAIRWFDKNKVENTVFRKDTAPYFFEKAGNTIWYRFYEIGTDKGIFGDRDGSVHYDISEISEERRTGYSWSGKWPAKIISAYNSVGYYADRIVVTVANTRSADINGKTLKAGEVYNPLAGNLADELEELPVEEIIYGDANYDKVLDASDSAIILQYAIDNSFLAVDDKWIKICDVDGDQQITASDSAMVLQKVLDASFVFSVEK